MNRKSKSFLFTLLPVDAGLSIALESYSRVHTSGMIGVTVSLRLLDQGRVVFEVLRRVM